MIERCRAAPVIRPAAAILSALVVVMAMPTSAVAATVGWVGAPDAAWSDGASWVGGEPPADGDHIVFPPAPAPGAQILDDVPTLGLGAITSKGAWRVEPVEDAHVTLSGPIEVDLFGQQPVGEPSEFLWLVPAALTQPLSVTSSYDAGIASFRAPLTGGQPVRAFGPGQVLLQGSGPNEISRITADGPSAGRVDVSNPATAPDTVVVESGGAAGFGTGTYSMPIEVGGPGTSRPTTPSSWAPGALRVPANNQGAQPVFSGPVTLTGATTFGTARTNESSALTVNGPLSGTFPLTLVGQGSITLGNAVAVASVDSQVRRLRVTGSITGPLALTDESTVEGTGTVNGLRMAAGTAMAVEVDGSASEHLTSTGPVRVDGTLHLGASALPPVGTTVLVLDNATDQPVEGTFDAVPEGGMVTAGGARWQLTYRGGDGNDIQIRRVALADLSVTAATLEIGAGGSAPATLVVGNSGPDQTRALLTVDLPAGTQAPYPGPGCAPASERQVICDVSVPAGASALVTLDITVTDAVAGAALAGRLTVTPADHTIDVDSDNDSAALTVIVMPSGPSPTPSTPSPTQAPTITPSPSIPWPPPSSTPAQLPASGGSPTPGASSQAALAGTGTAVPLWLPALGLALLVSGAALLLRGRERG